MESTMKTGALRIAAGTSELSHPVMMLTSGVTERPRPAALAAVGLVASVTWGSTDPWTAYPVVPALGTDTQSPGPATAPTGSTPTLPTASGDPEQGRDHHRGLTGPAPTSTLAAAAALGTPRAAAAPKGSPAAPLAAGGDPGQGRDHRGLTGPAPTSTVDPTAALGTPRAAASALAGGAVGPALD
jgi:hypothetical protein